MQLMPATGVRFGLSSAERADPAANVRAGVRYLKWLIRRFNGALPLALAGYNAGEGAVQKYGNQVPPYRETQQYVRLVLANYAGYRQRRQALALEPRANAYRLERASGIRRKSRAIACVMPRIGGSSERAPAPCAPGDGLAAAGLATAPVGAEVPPVYRLIAARHGLSETACTPWRCVRPGGNRPTPESDALAWTVRACAGAALRDRHPKPRSHGHGPGRRQHAG